MSDPSPTRFPVGALITGTMAIVCLPFLPLLFSIIESFVFGTRKVEEFFERLGIHDELGDFYNFVGHLFVR